MHTPVLLKEAIESLNVKKGGMYIDATFGEGGHAIKIIETGGKVLGIDADPKQIQNSEFRIQNFKQLKLVQGNYKDIEKIAKENDFFPVEGIIFDLGLSMRQINESGRGFSYKKLKEPLDMRVSQNSEIKADQIINSFDEEELYEIFTKYSEELNSRSVAKSIVYSRRIKKIGTVEGLRRVIDKATGRSNEGTYARIFQALRIYINDELENLKKGLIGGVEILKKSGRIVVISFQSVEDRVVKKFIKERNLKQINNKIITGDKNLKFERSAKLRIIGY